MNGRHVIHGLKLSYFTGKLEAYFRAMGIAHEFVEMDTRDFRACARATGIAQMPQVQCPDGSWLTDTTAIISRFEDEGAEPVIRPPDPGAAFVSLLLEDMFDEWLWRPALYYRWAFREDMTLMSAQIARTLLRDMPLPFILKRHFILSRQRRVFLKQDGVTPATAPLVEALYRNTLAALEPVFATRPFLMGGRPCEADFGLMGPFFRHFSHDPTPAAILRETAPHTLAWVARMWALDPATCMAQPKVTDVPDDLAPLLAMARQDYLPYLSANAAAYANGAGKVKYSSGGASWSVPVSPYRVTCLNALKSAFSYLPDQAQRAVTARLGAGAMILLEAGTPIRPAKARRPRDRHLT